MAEDHYCQGVKQRTSSLSGKEGRGKKREKRKRRELNFRKRERTTSTCYPVGQFSTYRLDKISSPPSPTAPSTPIFPDLGTNETFRQENVHKFYLAAPTPKMGMTGAEAAWLAENGFSSPFRIMCFPEAMLVPNRRLLHFGAKVCPTPTARSQVLLHLLPTHRAQLPKRARGGGAGNGKESLPPSQVGGTSKGFNSYFPTPRTAFQPPPQRSACVGIHEAVA